MRKAPARHRTVKGLRAVKAAGRQPFGRPRRLKGAFAAGIAYERNLAEAFPDALHGQWLEFLDANGLGYAQPDLQWDHGPTTYVLEAKLTWVPSARSQLEDLYLPLLRHLWPRRTFRGIIVAKYLTPESPEALVQGDFTCCVQMADSGMTPIFHWLGPRFPILRPKHTVVGAKVLDCAFEQLQLPLHQAPGPQPAGMPSYGP